VTYTPPSVPTKISSLSFGFTHSAWKSLCTPPPIGLKVFELSSLTNRPVAGL
jgi:hypothetical protein